MKVTLDATRCAAYGVCADLCPSLFQLDEWGYASVVGDGQVPPDQEAKAEEAAAACPEKAVALVA